MTSAEVYAVLAALSLPLLFLLHDTQLSTNNNNTNSNRAIFAQSCVDVAQDAGLRKPARVYARVRIVINQLAVYIQQ